MPKLLPIEDKKVVTPIKSLEKDLVNFEDPKSFLLPPKVTPVYFSERNKHNELVPNFVLMQVKDGGVPIVQSLEKKLEANDNIEKIVPIYFFDNKPKYKTNPKFGADIHYLGQTSEVSIARNNIEQYNQNQLVAYDKAMREWKERDELRKQKNRRAKRKERERETERQWERKREKERRYVKQNSAYYQHTDPRDRPLQWEPRRAQEEQKTEYYGSQINPRNHPIVDPQNFYNLPAMEQISEEIGPTERSAVTPNNLYNVPERSPKIETTQKATVPYDCNPSYLGDAIPCGELFASWKKKAAGPVGPDESVNSKFPISNAYVSIGPAYDMEEPRIFMQSGQRIENQKQQKLRLENSMKAFFLNAEHQRFVTSKHARVRAS